MAKHMLAPTGYRRHVRRRSAASSFDCSEERQLSLAFELEAVEPPGEFSEPPRTSSLQMAPLSDSQPAAIAVEVEGDDDAAASAGTSDVLLRLPAVKAKTGLGRTAIYKGMKDGTFPRQRKITGRSVGWSADAIQKWIKARPAVKG